MSIQKTVQWNFTGGISSMLSSTSSEGKNYTIQSLTNGGLSYSGSGLHITNYSNIPFVDLRSFHSESDSSFSIRMSFRENSSNNTDLRDIVYFSFGNIFKTHSGGHIIVYRDYSKKAANPSFISRPRLCTISRTTAQVMDNNTFTYAGSEFSNTTIQTIQLDYDSVNQSVTLRSVNDGAILDAMTDVTFSIGHSFLYLGTSTWYTLGGWNYVMDKANTFSVISAGTEGLGNINSLFITSGA